MVTKAILFSAFLVTALLGQACAPSAENKSVSDPLATSSSADKPNVIIIFVDDMGYADVSSYGGDWVETPHIDALAASGIRYTNGYSVAPVCGPSRVGLLSGAYPSRFGVFWNPDTLRAKVPASQPILTDIVREAGYQSAVVGKWNLANPVEDNADFIFDPMIWGAGYWPNPDGSYSGVSGEYGAGGRDSGLWGPESEGDEYLTDRLSQHAVNFISKDHDAPFLLYLAYNSPHSPLEAHSRYKADVAHLPDEPTQIYAAMLLSIDDGVGDVMAALEAKAITDNTVVYFISDNGPAVSDFKGYPADWPQSKTLGSTGPFTGQKRSMREGGIRVPFIMSWPEGIEAGQVIDTPVITTDLYPTIANLSGVKLADAVIIDGMDLLQPVPMERTLQWTAKTCQFEGPCTSFGALREGPWKLLLEPGAPARLFNLDTDPAEQTDLSGLEVDIFASMMKTYETIRADEGPAASEIRKSNVIEKPNASPPLSKILD